jgi:uncharacterized protein YggU (UPF0235/DUF167 family)
VQPEPVNAGDDALPKWLKACAGGSTIYLVAAPKSGRVAVEPDCEYLRVRVTAAAADGAANEAVIRALSDWSGVSRSAIAIEAGRTSRRKRVLLRGLSPSELLKRVGR